MNKLKKKNLFIEINDENFIVAVGKYDDDLNFNIIEKEIFLSSGFKNGKIIDLKTSTDNLKKIIKKVENKSNLFFSEANVIINHRDFECVNVSGFKKLNGNQILSEDISYIINDVKSKILEAENQKTIIHLFNTKFLLDNKPIKNLPIGLYGEFYSHQLTFFLIENNDIKNIKTLLNRCNLNLNKIILKSFTDGIKITHKKKEDTFIKIKINKNETELISFYNSAFWLFQKFSFGSDIILNDISKVCSLDILKVSNIIENLNLTDLEDNSYVDKKYFNETNFRKISVKLIKEISSARIEEIINIIFNKNKNLINFKNNEIPIYIEITDKKILLGFKEIFNSQFKKFKLNFYEQADTDHFDYIKIFGDLICKGWVSEAIPFVNKKSTWITRIFSRLFD